MGTVFKISRDGSIYQTLVSFGGGPDAFETAVPWGGPILGQNGLLYGTTTGGNLTPGGGLFSLTTDGSVFNVLLNYPTIPFLADLI